jgi:hypothetical protein
VCHCDGAVTGCSDCPSDEYVLNRCEPDDDNFCTPVPDACLLNGSCAGLGLTSIPQAISRSITSLNLTDNAIYAVDVRELARFTSLPKNTSGVCVAGYASVVALKSERISLAGVCVTPACVCGCADFLAATPRHTRCASPLTRSTHRSEDAPTVRNCVALRCESYLTDSSSLLCHRQRATIATRRGAPRACWRGSTPTARRRDRRSARVRPIRIALAHVRASWTVCATDSGLLLCSVLCGSVPCNRLAHRDELHTLHGQDLHAVQGVHFDGVHDIRLPRTQQPSVQRCCICVACSVLVVVVTSATVATCCRIPGTACTLPCATNEFESRACAGVLDRICVRCHASCGSCTSASEFQCTSCASTHRPYLRPPTASDPTTRQTCVPYNACSYSEWSPFSTCPVLCGGGTIRRSRSLLDVWPCHSAQDEVEAIACNQDPCGEVIALH